jgi:UDP-glucuronate decarboxylase
MYAYETQAKVEVRVARIFNTFGPRMHPNDGRVVSNFIIQALQGNSLYVYGNGEQTRSFQYVEDLVAGLMALMESDYSKPVNIGNPEEFTIKEFATMIQQQVNKASPIEVCVYTFLSLSNSAESEMHRGSCANSHSYVHMDSKTWLHIHS